MIHMDNPGDGPNCVQCGEETITDAKGICYDCWAVNDLKDYEEQLAKKKLNFSSNATGNNTVDVDTSTDEINLVIEEE